MNARKNMEEALRLLKEVKDSGYWPFASPAPCSTEVKIKDGIYEAINGVENALFWHDKMFTEVGRDPMKCTSFKIVQR